MSPELDLFFRIGAAVLAGGIIGIERLLSHKIAGMRTYAMVSAGSAAFMYLATTIFQGASANPYVVMGQIVVGVGFLGAGSIINNRGEVQGLTTASGLWVTAAAGAAFGLGFYTTGFMISCFALLILAVLYKVEKYITDKYLK